MNLLQNSKFTGPALLLLLCLNTTLLAMLLFRHPGPPPPPHFPPPPMENKHGGPRDFIVHELAMTQDQQNKYDTLIKSHHSAMQKIQNDIRLYRDSLITMLSKNAMDSAQINSLAEKIGMGQAQIEKTTFHHFQNVRAICTPEQQPKFDSVIKEALRMMGPPPPPPGGPHGPPPPMGNPPPPPGN